MSAPFQLFDAPDDDTLAALRESIARRGVICPVVKDQHGRILDGHHRVAISDDLGQSYPEVVLDVDDDADAADIARLVNSVRRHMPTEQRRSNVVTLRSTGHSLRAIASAVGVSKTTVERDLAGSGVPGGTPGEVTGRDGKTYPGFGSHKMPEDEFTGPSSPPAHGGEEVAEGAPPPPSSAGATPGPEVPAEPPRSTQTKKAYRDLVKARRRIAAAWETIAEAQDVIDACPKDDLSEWLDFATDTRAWADKFIAKAKKLRIAS